MSLQDSIRLALSEFKECDRFNPENHPEEGPHLRAVQRKLALAAVLRDYGFEGVVTLARQAGSPPLVGRCLSDLTGSRHHHQIGPELLNHSDEALVQFAQAFKEARVNQSGSVQNPNNSLLEGRG